MKIEFGKLKIGVTKKIMNLIVQLLPNITPLILDQFTCSLPKNVTTFHRQQDGINHFCLRPNKCGVLALWIHIFTKIFSKLDCSTSFKLPKHPFYWDWDKNEWLDRQRNQKVLLNTFYQQFSFYLGYIMTIGDSLNLIAPFTIVRETCSEL